MNLENYKNQIKNDRKEKDIFFKQNFQSPISLEEIANFTKLNYFESDLEYKFELELEEFSNKEKVKIKTGEKNYR